MKAGALEHPGGLFVPGESRSSGLLMVLGFGAEARAVGSNGQQKEACTILSAPHQDTLPDMERGKVGLLPRRWQQADPPTVGGFGIVGQFSQAPVPCGRGSHCPPGSFKEGTAESFVLLPMALR